jgi:hypothetical protein
MLEPTIPTRVGRPQIILTDLTDQNAQKHIKKTLIIEDSGFSIIVKRFKKSDVPEFGFYF